jgi:hypothetical protein
LQASPATSPRKSFTFPAGEAPDEDPEDLEDGEHRARLGSAEDWEAEPIDRASLAIAAPAHRDHIKEHLRELMDAVKSMEDKSETLLEVHPLLIQRLSILTAVQRGLSELCDMSSTRSVFSFRVFTAACRRRPVLASVYVTSFATVHREGTS